MIPVNILYGVLSAAAAVAGAIGGGAVAKRGAAKAAGEQQKDHAQILHQQNEIAALQYKLQERDSPARKRKKVGINALVSAIASVGTVAVIPHIPGALPVLEVVCEAVANAVR